MTKQYQQSKCSGKECAFPGITCNQCVCNRDIMGRKAVVVKDPKYNYRFAKLVCGINKN